MSFKDGNAWALRRAREREQMRLSGDTEQGSLSSLKIVKTISPDLGKLDFDSDLALPMPNPRTARANSIVNDSLSSSPSIPASGSGSGSLWSRSIAKKRSFTEPGRLAAAAASAGEKKSDKKSTFKALKAKLSLKDLKKEFRKDVPPASTMPKITILRDSSSSDPFAGKGNNFEVERLYTPRPRVMEVGSESLSRESSVIRLDDCLKDFRKVSDSSVRTPMKDGIAGGVGGERMSELGTKFRHTLIHSNDAEEGPASNLLDAVLLSGSSPAARTGEYRNSRLPEVVNTPQRACSYAAEPASPKSAASTVRESEAARMYSPSVYETALSDRMSDLPRRDYGVTSVEDVISLTPTRDSDSSVKKGSDTRLSSLASPASTFHAGPDESPSDYVPVDKAQLMGSTGRGGFAPMPPDPEYQNTAALEEQLASHVEQLHFHVQHAASKLVKTFEDKNNWHMDQVLRHVDTMVDLAQAINKKAAAQTELLREAQTAVADVRAHIDTLRREVRVIKSKIITAIHEEFGKLRYDLQEEGKLGPGNPASEGILTPSAGLQGPSFPVLVNRDLSEQKDGMDKMLQKKEDAKDDEKKMKKKSEQEKKEERKQAAPSTVLRSASLVNSTSSAYLSARDHQHQVTEKRVTWKDDYADSSGSPTPKASTFLDLPDLLVPAIEQAEALLTPAAQPKMEKPASKRSFFNLRRHRDSDNNASRTQENKHQAGDNNKAQENKNKPQVVDNTKLTTPTSNQESSVDPSTIHPLHRTPEQRRNLIERDLERIRLEKQQLAMLTTPSPTPARRPGVLKLSKSHTSISASNTLTTPSYDNGVSSSPPTLHGWPLPDVYKNRLPILPSRSSNSASTPAGFDNPYPIFRHPVPASSLGNHTPTGSSSSQGGAAAAAAAAAGVVRPHRPAPLTLVPPNNAGLGRKREGSGRHRSGTLERVEE
ncbi:hypothetical protein CBS147343_10289 [Aspergillus niger]|nr:hypothetical protein CBS133816_6952 [Aspergillus niger]KAI2865094.1 hypothetical protein CBS12448_2382 [Aspergillus niger]KAI2935901.1 hypothetical protein CBS147320_134 [Aspergillus niger]KAI2936222.1 hypothetical protein CBS147321_8543 [Aspergillus niger]KAI2944504.1 hypothetical protein CBS147322_8033 [Aspergillus niger]